MIAYDEIHRAQVDVEIARRQWNFAQPEFERAAWHKVQAAEARLDALYAERKQDFAPRPE